jgi:hypothetical protein
MRPSYRTEMTAPVDSGFYATVESHGDFKFNRLQRGDKEVLLVGQGFCFSDGVYVERWFYEDITMVYKDDEDTGFGPHHAEVVTKRISISNEDP